MSYFYRVGIGAGHGLLGSPGSATVYRYISHSFSLIYVLTFTFVSRASVPTPSIRTPTRYDVFQKTTDSHPELIGGF